MTIKELVEGLNLSPHNSIDITVQKQTGEKIYRGDHLEPSISESVFDAASIGASEDDEVLELLFIVGGLNGCA